MEVDSSGGNRTDYKVVQKIISLRPVYEIYDESTGEKVAIARQTWLSFLRSTIHMEDLTGNRILTAKGGFFDKTFHLLDESGQPIAKLTRPWIALRKNFTIQYRDEMIKSQGGYLAWGFEAYSNSGHFAFRLDKKILSVRDQFRVSVGEFMDWSHAVASALVVDRVFFKGKSCMGRLICCCLPLIIILFTFTILLAMLGSP
ncbi:MAG: hypothetical protein BAJATHORv1_20032 [Candidatus Thorarchaeota archaeon]|nr:MAG: hypothetical protein BAJATHORv1_20032 [Candidatus Thorarchaeota archaeon]